MNLQTLEQILEKANEEREATHPRMDIDRSRQILGDAAAVWEKPNPFSVGDIIKPASHSAMWRQSFGLVRVRRIYPRVRIDPDDTYRIITHDMTVLAIGDNGTVGEFIADSRDFDLVERAP